MASYPVLDAETQALIAQLVVDSFDYFANGPPTTTWDPSLGPSQIGMCYQDYEEPLSSYERELLEGPVNADSDESWTVPDTAVLSPQTTVSLGPDERWKPDADDDEEYKQDRIIATQLQEVMDERELNGLRMQSPPAIPRISRIVDLAMGCSNPDLNFKRLGVSPLGGDIVPGSPSFNTISPRGGCFHQPPSDVRGSIRGGILMDDNTSCVADGDHVDKPMSRGRARKRSQQGFPECGQPSSKAQRPYACHSKQNSVEQRWNGRSNLNSLHSTRDLDQSDKYAKALPDLEVCEEAIKAHEKLPEAHSYPHSNCVHKPLRASENCGPSNMVPSQTDNSKGKEREHSPVPISQDHLIPNNSRKSANYQSWQGAAYFDDEEKHDVDTGESIVYIPWIRRDIHEGRINDSKVIEIHLGNTSEDECTIYELPSKVNMDDSGFSTFMDDGMRDNDILVDGPWDHGWEVHLGENERITLGQVPRRKNLTMEDW